MRQRHRRRIPLVQSPNVLRFIDNLRQRRTSNVSLFVTRFVSRASVRPPLLERENVRLFGAAVGLRLLIANLRSRSL